MKKSTILLLAALIFVLGAYIFDSYKTSNIRNLIYLPSKEIRVDERLGAVSLSGSWIPEGDLKNHFFGEKEVNTTEIQCYKRSMTCAETRGVITYLDSGSQKYGFYVLGFEYEIKEWTENYLRAEYNGIGRNFFVTINLKNLTASIDIKDNQDSSTASAYTDTAVLGK